MTNMPDGFIQKVRKARKTHTCCECGRDITPGELYTYERGIWEDGPESYKTCNDCVSLRHLIDDFVYGCLYEDLYLYVDSVDGKVPTDVLNGVTPEAKRSIEGLVIVYENAALARSVELWTKHARPDICKICTSKCEK